jgi:hypothetical protein
MGLHTRIIRAEKLLPKGGEPIPERLPMEVYAALDAGEPVDESGLPPGQLSTLRTVLAMLATIPRRPEDEVQ